jgi:hypothetical protein
MYLQRILLEVHLVLMASQPYSANQARYRLLKSVLSEQQEGRASALKQSDLDSLWAVLFLLDSAILKRWVELSLALVQVSEQDRPLQVEGSSLLRVQSSVPHPNT